MGRHKPIIKSDTLISKIGISEYFSKHSSEINETVKLRRTLKNPILIKLAEDHANDYQLNYEKKETIVLVCPFQFMQDKKYLNERTRKDFNKYYEKLNFVLNNSNPDFSLVLYDSYLNYLTRTGKLVEEGHFDKVIFSEQLDGFLINNFGIKEYFENKKIFIGGLYNQSFIGKAITEIKENSSPKRVRGIRDLILEKISLDKNSIKSRRIYDRWGKKVRTVTVEDLFEDKFE